MIEMVTTGQSTDVVKTVTPLSTDLKSGAFTQKNSKPPRPA
jgi:hypothetical protein